MQKFNKENIVIPMTLMVSITNGLAAERLVSI